MENPANEITNVIKLVTAAVNPEIQKAAVLQYYARDMSFRHPLCIIPSAFDSRDAMLPILQWYRMLSPMIKGDVSSVTYDEEKHIVFLDVTQIFHIRSSPLNPAPARYVYRPRSCVYLIEEQEDFYHPDDLMALLAPPLISVVRLALRTATFACKV
ncbi:hypothetical protein OH76DRAFT_1330941, partial [Lentinus brumalis]